MDLQLSNKVAVVTGASRGIGRAIAQVLAAEGMRLVLAARSEALLAELAASLPVEAVALAVDLRDPATPAIVIEAAIKSFGRLDLLVNNAGATKRGDFLLLSDEDWADGYALKFFGAMRCCRAAWPHLKASGGGIVNIAGIGGRTASAEFTIGGSVNSALVNFTKALADRGVIDGVRANAINPGSIVTERLEQRLQRMAADKGMDATEAAKILTASSGIARFGEAAEIARAVAFLASPQAAFCQGAILDIDGGQTRTI